LASNFCLCCFILHFVVSYRSVPSPTTDADDADGDGDDESMIGANSNNSGVGVGAVSPDAEATHPLLRGGAAHGHSAHGHSVSGGGYENSMGMDGEIRRSAHATGVVDLS